MTRRRKFLLLAAAAALLLVLLWALLGTNDARMVREARKIKTLQEADDFILKHGLRVLDDSINIRNCRYEVNFRYYQKFHYFHWACDAKGQRGIYTRHSRVNIFSRAFSIEEESSHQIGVSDIRKHYP